MGAPRLPTTDLSAMNTRRLHSSLLTLLLGIVLPYPLMIAKTRGGWRWRWGDDE